VAWASRDKTKGYAVQKVNQIESNHKRKRKHIKTI